MAQRDFEKGLDDGFTDKFDAPQDWPSKERADYIEGWRQGEAERKISQSNTTG